MIGPHVKKHVPGKRIKAWHRAAKREGVSDSLRTFARALLMLDGFAKTAAAWAGGKIARNAQVSK